MANPERIHVIWNAAEGYERFADAGLTASHLHVPTADQITAVLAKQQGGLFRLLGWDVETKVDLVMRIAGDDEAGLHITNYEPPVDAIMVVAEEPPPMVTIHGDYVFDLVTVDQNQNKKN